MQAKETKVQEILEGTKQYVVPLFQRPYSWEKRDWETLWKDIMEQYESENPRLHFLGSIVSIPTVSVPEGVAKYLLIDGQQRLTTIFIILSSIAKLAKTTNEELASEITNTLVVNQFKKEQDYFKLLPTQLDRHAYQSLILEDVTQLDSQSKIVSAQNFFLAKISRNLNLEKLKKVITNNISLVSIVLDSDDNPHLVFESLNAKGKPLTPSDLIRNYIFMRIHVSMQQEVYENFWRPIEERLEINNISEFIRHYLIRGQRFVKKDEVYSELKGQITQDNAVAKLQDIAKFSGFYEKLLFPLKNESDIEIKSVLARLNIIEVTTAYPLILEFYDMLHNERLSKNKFIELLKTLENFLVRRYIVNEPTYTLNKLFISALSEIKKSTTDTLTVFQNFLAAKNYPSDSEFQDRLINGKLYGPSEKIKKAKLILESIEKYLSGKEEVRTENLTIEHVMPQTLTPEWEDELGELYDETHDLKKDTLGNLTLTAYNPELSNSKYSDKKLIYAASRLALNEYFTTTDKWNSDQIELRAKMLSDVCLKIWPRFGDEFFNIETTENILAKKPTRLVMLGHTISVNSWRDVLEQTLNTLLDLEPEKMVVIKQELKSVFEADYGTSRTLKDGTKINVYLNSKSIRSACYQAIEIVELTKEDWRIEF